MKEGVPTQNPAQNNGYFDVYFSGEDIENIKTPQRFVFEEEPSEDTKAIIDAVNAAHEAKQETGFEIVDVSRGILTSLPDENGNIPKQSGEDFEPPSMIQMEERLDPATQAALDAGAPIDEAVMAAKRISRAEAEQAAQSINIIAKENIEATKIINYKLPSVSLLAKHLYISTTYLRNCFLKELSVTPKAYLTSLRMTSAQSLLNTGYYSVSSVAEQVGFGDAKNFAVAYKKHFGYPPSAQRYQDFL